MLAVEVLSAGWQAVLFAIATILFLVAAFVPVRGERAPGVFVRGVNLVALGLAFYTFVFFWNALAQS